MDYRTCVQQSTEKTVVFFWSERRPATSDFYVFHMDEQYKFDFICSLMHELSDFNSLAIYHALDASRFIFFCKTRIVIVKFPEEKKT